MKFELNTLPRNCSKKEIISEIKRVDSLIGKDKLISKNFNKLAKITVQSISKRFGSWEQALIAAGLEHKYYGTNITKKMRQQSKKLTDGEILQELRRIAQKLGQNFVTQENINSNSEIIGGSTVVYRFGSWEKGIKKAGLENSPKYNRKLSDEEYFENLLNVWIHYGKQPKYCDMGKNPSVISPRAYENHFKTWRKALEGFIARMNQKEQKCEPVFKKETEKKPIREEVNKHSVAVEDRRGVSLSLRYKVLNRDKFKCVKCGSSPATNLACKLHIDHIIPFSKDGKTILENLQTLCKNCNLGKGNRYSE